MIHWLEFNVNSIKLIVGNTWKVRKDYETFLHLKREPHTLEEFSVKGTGMGRLWEGTRLGFGFRLRLSAQMYLRILLQSPWPVQGCVPSLLTGLIYRWSFLNFPRIGPVAPVESFGWDSLCPHGPRWVSKTDYARSWAYLLMQKHKLFGARPFLHSRFISGRACPQNRSHLKGVEQKY